MAPKGMGKSGWQSKGMGKGGWQSDHAVRKPQFQKRSQGAARQQSGSRKFDVSQRVWIGGMSEEVTEADLQELCNTVGNCELVEFLGTSGTACACYATAAEARTAISTLNGSYAGDVVLQFDSWVAEPRAKANSSSGNPAKDHLVARIKDFQRSDADQKQSWWDFCDENLEGQRDPAKADAFVLQQFIDTNGVPDVKMATQKGKGGARATGDPAKDALVARIKDYQRSDAEQKELWWSFCDENLEGQKDPAKADVATLQNFCEEYSVP